MNRWRLDAIMSIFVTVHPHETSALLHSSSCFFFVSPNLTITFFFPPKCRSITESIIACLFFFCVCVWTENLFYFSLSNADFERVFCGSPIAGWGCHLVRVIESAWSVFGVFGSHFNRCACFNSRFLMA